MATFILVSRSGEDTLHQHPSFEECNVDDSLHHQVIDAATAQALLASGSAKACQYCEPVPDPQRLNTRSDAP